MHITNSCHSLGQHSQLARAQALLEKEAVFVSDRLHVVMSHVYAHGPVLVFT